MMELTAIIPARAGSRRLKDKNIQEINGEPMLVRKVRQAQESRIFSEIIVSSDSRAYLDLVAPYGVRLHLREREHSDERSRSFGETVAHLAALARTADVVWLPCTAPLFGPGHMREAAGLHAWLGTDGCRTYTDTGYVLCDSLVAVSSIQTYLMNTDGVPVNYEPKDHVPSQGLPVVCPWAGAWWSARRDDMIAWQYFHGLFPSLYYCGKVAAVDVDTEEDLAIARALA